MFHFTSSSKENRMSNKGQLTKQIIASFGLLIGLLISTYLVITLSKLYVREDNTSVLTARKIKHATAPPFSEVVHEVCKNSKTRLPKYQGVDSLEGYLQNADTSLCDSWLSFGGESSIDTKNESKSSLVCMNTPIKRKSFCMDKTFRRNSCLVYSFSDELDNNFEKQITKFGCQTHTFQTISDFGYEESRRNERWYQYNWELSDVYRELWVPVLIGSGITFYDQRKERTMVRRMPLGTIIRTLGHEGAVIDYLSCTVFSKSWRLMMEIVRFSENADIKQFAVGVILPHEYKERKYEQIYQLLEGLTCVGYRLARQNHFRIPDAPTIQAFELTFIKDSK